MASKPAVSYWLTMVLERNVQYLADIPISVLTTGDYAVGEDVSRRGPAKMKPKVAKSLVDLNGH